MLLAGCGLMLHPPP